MVCRSEGLSQHLCCLLILSIQPHLLAATEERVLHHDGRPGSALAADQPSASFLVASLRQPTAEDSAVRRLTPNGQPVCGEGGLCSGHGVCNIETGRCECEPLFEGPACELEHCPGYKEQGVDCHGHGLCDSGACQCAPGWGLLAGKTGVNLCADKVCALPCDHGSCVDGQCQCLPGWKGPNCRDPDCVNECSGHGSCALPSTHSPGECICDYGWAGPGCERKGLYEVLRRCPEDCSGNGLCLNGVCSCNVGFAGPACTEVECGDDYSGSRCDIKRCPNDCTGRGLCMAGQCACWKGFNGRDCSVPTNCLEPCGRVCDAKESSEQCVFCLGQCTTARSHSGFLGNHNPFEDLEATLL